MGSTGWSNLKVSCVICILLLIPLTLFIVSLIVRPAVGYDPGYGFLAFRSMLEGGTFNNVTAPDPANIANDATTFLSWWSPGQYLIPGTFVRFGTTYGLAISLTTLFATVIGVFGWAQLARNFNVSNFVLFFFSSGLVTFRYVTLPFRIYDGGEVLLFAVSPWFLYMLQWVVDKPPATCFAISVLSAALLFFAKLTGLVVFAASIVAISLVEILKGRRITSSLLAIWAGCAVAAFLFFILWLTRGTVPASGSGFNLTWPAIWFPFAGAAFSGISAIDLLSWLLVHPPAPILSDITATSYVLGPLGLLLMGWVWFRLRDTRYRPMAIYLFTIIALLTAALTAMYLRSAVVSFDERHLRYAGIIFFLLLLVALDQWHTSLAVKVVPTLIIGSFSVYGLVSYVNGVRELMRGHHYDSASGISMMIVSPVVLKYLRSEMAVHNWKHAVVVVPTTEAAMGLPHFRIIEVQLDFVPLEYIANKRWAGRAEQVFVIVQEKMLGNGKAEALLKSFVDYDYTKWDKKQIDEMVVYSQ
jgi:hypothetical protein